MSKHLIAKYRDRLDKANPEDRVKLRAEIASEPKSEERDRLLGFLDGEDQTLPDGDPSGSRFVWGPGDIRILKG